MGNDVKTLPMDFKCPICCVKPKVHCSHKTRHKKGGPESQGFTEIICGFCRQFVRYAAIDKHRATECPCYCQYCGITAESEVINQKHKEKCLKYYFLPESPRVSGLDIRQRSNKRRLTTEIKKITHEYIKDESIAKHTPVTSSDAAEGNSQQTSCYNPISITVFVLVTFFLLVLFFMYLRPIRIIHEPVAPVIFVINNFTRRLYTKHKYQLYSDPFFAFWRGYKMYFSVDVYGRDTGERTHVSVYLSLTKGPYDDRLEQSGHWPMQGTFKIELLDQVRGDCYTRQISFDGTNRVTQLDMEMGFPQFIPHNIIYHSSYLYNDSVYFRISYQSNSVPKIKDTSYEMVAPVMLKMHNFTRKMNTSTKWWSEHFFAFRKGYMMTLGIDANGSGDGEGTHISVYLHLLKGPYDNELELSGHWPLKGIFRIALLDQLNYENHAVSLSLDGTSSNYNRVLEHDMAPGASGFSKFISHSNILHSNYLKNDTLYFLISFQYSP